MTFTDNETPRDKNRHAGHDLSPLPPPDLKRHRRLHIPRAITDHNVAGKDTS